MKPKKTFKAVALSGLLLAGIAGAAQPPSPQGRDPLVSGEPHPGFFEGVRVEADGPVTADIVGHGEGNASKVVRKTLRMSPTDGVSLTEVHPEAFIGIPEAEGTEGTAAAVARTE